VSGPYVEQTGEVGGRSDDIADGLMDLLLEVRAGRMHPAAIQNEVRALVAAAEERGARAERERWAGWPRTDNRVPELMTYDDLPPDIKAIVERAGQDGGLRYAAREEVKYMLPKDKALAWSIVDGIALVAERMLRGAS